MHTPLPADLDNIVNGQPLDLLATIIRANDIAATRNDFFIQGPLMITKTSEQTCITYNGKVVLLARKLDEYSPKPQFDTLNIPQGEAVVTYGIYILDQSQERYREAGKMISGIINAR